MGGKRMKRASRIGLQEAVKVLDRIQEVLYLDSGPSSTKYWNPDKEWNFHTIHNVVDALANAGLVPEDRKVEK